MDDGTVQEIGDGYRLRFERELEHPVEKVWAFLTEPERFGTWLAEGEMDLRPGGRVYLKGDEIDSTITELQPQRVLAYGWKTAEWDGGIIRFELEPTSTGTKLVLIHDMSKLSAQKQEEFKQRWELPEGWEQLSSTLAGWHTILARLAKALDGTADAASMDWRGWDDDAMQGWRDLNEHYKRVLAR